MIWITNDPGEEGKRADGAGLDGYSRHIRNWFWVRLHGGVARIEWIVDRVDSG
jgi:hypothetical protein